MAKLCGKCQGRKKYMAMGGMLKDCDACRATGYVDEVKKVKKKAG